MALPFLTQLAQIALGAAAGAASSYSKQRDKAQAAERGEAPPPSGDLRSTFEAIQNMANQGPKKVELAEEQTVIGPDQFEHRVNGDLIRSMTPDQFEQFHGVKRY